MNKHTLEVFAQFDIAKFIDSYWRHYSQGVHISEDDVNGILEKEYAFDEIRCLAQSIDLWENFHHLPIEPSVNNYLCFEFLKRALEKNDSNLNKYLKAILVNYDITICSNDLTIRMYILSSVDNSGLTDINYGMISKRIGAIKNVCFESHTYTIIN